MNKLVKQKEEFLNEQLSKNEYLEEIYAHHTYLFDYSEFMKGTNILK